MRSPVTTQPPSTATRGASEREVLRHGVKPGGGTEPRAAAPARRAHAQAREPTRAAAGALRSQETSGLRSPCAPHYALTDTALCVVRRGEGPGTPQPTARHPVPGAQWADAPCAQPPAPLGSSGRVCGRGCGLSLPRHAPLCLDIAGARPRSLDLWASAHAAGVTPGLSAALCRPQSGAR